MTYQDLRVIPKAKIHPTSMWGYCKSKEDQAVVALSKEAFSKDTHRSIKDHLNCI